MFKDFLQLCTAPLENQVLAFCQSLEKGPDVGHAAFEQL